MHQQQIRHLSTGIPLSSPRHWQQIVHLSTGTGTPLRAHDTGNKSYILALGPHVEPQKPATNRPLRTQNTGNESYILAVGPHFEPKTPATNRTFWHWDPTSSPRHRQQIVHLSTGTPLRAQDTGNNLYILALGRHFELKTPAANRTC